jgi:hypothetical protein
MRPWKMAGFCSKKSEMGVGSGGIRGYSYEMTA